MGKLKENMGMERKTKILKRSRKGSTFILTLLEKLNEILEADDIGVNCKDFQTNRKLIIRFHKSQKKMENVADNDWEAKLYFIHFVI